MRKNKKLVSALVALSLVVVSLVGCSVASAETVPVETGVEEITSNTALYFDENAVTSLYETSIPAVVQIYVETTVDQETSNPFGFDVPQQQGQGSGFIIDEEGHILTNNHVVDGVTDIEVILYDGKVLIAEIIGTDRENDVALLKVDPDSLNGISPLPMGDSDSVKPGQMAIALGSPYGLQNTITTGIISGVDRSLTSLSQRSMPKMLQTDAQVNPGSSGGPLLNSSGEVVGINTALESLSSGIGFAVPINTAKTLLPDLLSGGEVETAWLGIEAVAINEEVAAELDLSVNSGIYVVNVTEDSPADEAGLVGGGTGEQGEANTGGDVITAINGEEIGKVEDVIAYLNAMRPGDTVTLSVQRQDSELTIDVVLGEWPDNLN